MPEPEMPQDYPYIHEELPGVYKWCACGKSANQPYCDGSHKGSGFSPVVAEIKNKEVVSWCGCKRTKKPPFCDGSHNYL